MSSDSPSNDPHFSWRAHPARERGGYTFAAGVIIMALAVIIFFSFGFSWAIVSCLVLIVALNRFFFPSRFEIDDEGITARYPLRRQHFRWRDLRRFVHDRYGGYLSTRSKTSRLDAYTGMHLLFGHNDHALIVERIAARMRKGNAA